MSESIRFLIVHIAAIVVFATCFYSIYQFGITRNRGFAYISLALFFPALILMMFTANFIGAYK